MYYTNIVRRFAQQWGLLIALGAVVVLGYAVRLHNFSGHWLWQDELTTLNQIFNNDYEWTADAPLYQSLLAFISWLTGQQTVDAFRLYSILLSGLLPIAAYGFTKKLHGKQAALYAAILSAFLEQVLVQAVNIRPYSLFMILCLCTYTQFITYLRGKSNGVALMLLLALCSLTHLLTVQIYLSILIAYGCCVLLAKKNVASFSTTECTPKRLLVLTALVAIAGMVGNLWALERIGSFYASALAVHETTDSGVFLHFWLQKGLLGREVTLPLVCGAWCMYAVGLIALWKKQRSAVVFLGTLFVVVGLVSLAALGSRAGWQDASRYTLHLIVANIAVVAIGMATVHRWVMQMFPSKFVLIIPYVLMGVSMMLNALLANEQRYKRQDSTVRGYSLVQRYNPDVIALDTGSRMTQYWSLFLQEKEDNRPFFRLEYRSGKVFIIRGDAKAMRMEEIVSTDIHAGTYIANVTCAELLEYLQQYSNKTLLLQRHRQIDEKYGRREMYLCRLVETTHL